jgi:hypothetical protein
MFNKQEQKTIKGKLRQLKKVKERTLSSQELADIIAQRRIKWL